MTVIEDIIIYKSGKIFRNADEVEYIVIDNKLAFTSKYCYVYDPQTYLDCKALMEKNEKIEEYLYFVDSLVYGMYHRKPYASLNIEHINGDQLDNELSNLMIKYK
jgi:hypothetical protein